MLTVRRSAERGHADHGWLDSHHTFSFDDYHDPAQMGFRVLRVLNEDRVAAGRGFPSHSHRDMEILSYVLDGELSHRDSMGTGSVIRPNDVQIMSAGTGVVHSEFNASKTAPVHFLQIWIVPERDGLAPRYEQRRFEPGDKRGQLRLVAASGGAEGAVTLHQDARVYATILAPGERITHAIATGRYGYVHVARGGLRVGEVRLAAGDAAKVSDQASLELSGDGEEAEALLFDLP